MSPAAATRRKRAFDPDRFLATIGQGRNSFAVAPKEKDLHPGGCGGCCLLYSKRQSAAHSRIASRQGGHHRHFERGEFLLRRLVGRPASPYGISCGYDRLPDSADREEGDDGRAS
jgi:hypothetical protein